MEFEHDGKVITLKGSESVSAKKISFSKLQALLSSKDDIYGVYELHAYHPDISVDNDSGTKWLVELPNRITQVLKQYTELFDVPNGLPPHRLIDHRINLLPQTKLVNVRPYHYLHYQKGEIENLVVEMLDRGIIRMSHSPYSSPSLVGQEKDGSYRFCVDYRALNDVIVKDKFSIPTAYEMFDELGGANVFTKIDLRGGYHRIGVHERDIYKTAFRTHRGHYEFLVMHLVSRTRLPSGQ